MIFFNSYIFIYVSIYSSFCVLTVSNKVLNINIINKILKKYVNEPLNIRNAYSFKLIWGPSGDFVFDVSQWLVKHVSDAISQKCH